MFINFSIPNSFSKINIFNLLKLKYSYLNKNIQQLSLVKLRNKIKILKIINKVFT